MSRTTDAARPSEPGPQTAGLGRSLLGSDGLMLLLLLGATLVAYLPVWHAGLIWDDDGHVTRADLRTLHGLWRIWFEPGATQQYYPLLHSAFWLEHRIWGDAALGYHLTNVALHALAAFLLYRLLRLLSLPGARFAACAFALHPVCVESVAWISEQKNTLSAVLCLSAALAYLRFDRLRRPAGYALALVLFAAALATKTVTATLPASLLVLFWWKRGRLSWKGDVLPMLPLFVLGAVAGLVTAWVERTYIGASGAAFDFGVADRVLVAGRALWFYLGKVFWPADLLFIYPRWHLDASAAGQYAFPAAAAVALAVLFALRRRARGPLAAALLFAGTLFPALGFINVFPFVYSFVADHFQYLAAAIAISATAAAVAAGASRLPRWGRAFVGFVGVCVLAALGWLTSLQCATYVDAETLWRATLAGNPQCWMAYQNLGGVFMKANRADLAVPQFQKALDINPDDTEAMNELGVAVMQQGQTEQAIALFTRALEIAPNKAETHINLGVALLQKGDPEKAANHFQHAAQTEPMNAQARKDLAMAYSKEGQWDDAVTQYQRAADIEPANPETLFGLGSVLTRAGRLDEAMAQFRRVLAIDDGHSEAHFNLALGLLREGKADDAVSHLKRALEINPGFAEAHDILGNAFLQEGKPDDASAQIQAAVALKPDDAQIQNDVGAMRARQGSADEAVAHYRKALEIDPGFATARVNLANILLQGGRAAEAASEYTRALEAEPNDAHLRNNLGIALVRDGRMREAAEQFRKALEIDPGYADARRNLSIVLGTPEATTPR
jgi:tetratricopeptide (TPR) repeat protein